MNPERHASAPVESTSSAEKGRRLPKSEEAYLRLQADEARTAVQRVARELGSRAAGAVDPRPLVRRHPWLTLGAAVPVGFGATLLASAALRRTRRHSDHDPERYVTIARQERRRGGGLRRLLRLGYRLARMGFRLVTTSAVAAASTKAASKDGAAAAHEYESSSETFEP